MGALMVDLVEHQAMQLLGCPGRRRKLPVPPVAGDALLKSHGKYRYWLKRLWTPREPVILWVLHAPGVGTARTDDAAIRRITGWSYRWGFGGMLVATLYPLCAATQEDLLTWRRRAHAAPPAQGGWHHFLEAARDVGAVARHLRCRTRVAAWGRLDDVAREDLDEWCEAFGAHPPDMCLGISDNGDPLNPSARGASRVFEDAELQSFCYPIGIGRP
jgi:hypothetical protein